MVHHLAHEVHMSHEDTSKTFLEQVVETLQAHLECTPLADAHFLGQRSHHFCSLRLLARLSDRIDEKLYRRFLEDYGGVRGLRLS